MKKTVLYDDPLQQALRPLTQAIKSLEKLKDKCSREILVLALASGELGPAALEPGQLNTQAAEELQARLLQAGLPDSNASQLKTIYLFPDLACACAGEELSLRQALAQARARLRGQPDSQPEEERLTRCADELLELWGARKAWTVPVGPHKLEFEPHPQPPSTAAAPTA